jgi:DNA invertase Pin-like site-specific DNA recombinase
MLQNGEYGSVPRRTIRPYLRPRKSGSDSAGIVPHFERAKERQAVKPAIYARVSTSDKEQDPVTQLLPLREFVKAQGWEIYGEYVDKVPATDMAHRTAWHDLLQDASKKRFDLLLVWRMDRAFRSVLDAATTLERLRTWKVGLRSYTEPWLDITSPFGEAL